MVVSIADSFAAHEVDMRLRISERQLSAAIVTQVRGMSNMCLDGVWCQPMPRPIEGHCLRALRAAGSLLP